MVLVKVAIKVVRAERRDVDVERRAGGCAMLPPPAAVTVA